MEVYIFALITVAFLGAIWFGSRNAKSMHNFSQQLILFPNIFKALGVLLVVISVAMVVHSAMHEKEVWKSIAMHSTNLGLFFYCFAKDKLEDELTSSVRLRAFYTSVISGIILLVFTSFIEFLMGDKEYVYSATKLVTVILAVYAFSYTSLKRKVFYGK